MDKLPNKSGPSTITRRKALGDQGAGALTITTRSIKVLGDQKQLSSPATPIKFPSTNSNFGTPVSKQPRTSSKLAVPAFTAARRTSGGMPKLGVKVLPSRKAKQDALEKINVTTLHQRLQLTNDVAMLKNDLMIEVKNNSTLRDDLIENELRVRSLENVDNLTKQKVLQLEEEVKLLKSYTEQLTSQLDTKCQEEQARKVQEEEVKSSMLAELALKEDVFKIKTDLITQLEKSLKNLRMELSTLKEKQSAEQESLRISNSKSCRGSISNMQSTFNTMEKKLEEVTKEFGLTKVDLRICRRENESLKTQLLKVNNQNFVLDLKIKQNDIKLEEREKVADANKELPVLKEKLEENNLKYLAMLQAFEDTSDSLRVAKSQNDALSQELNEKIDVIESLSKQSLKEKETKLNENSELHASEQKIQSQAMSIAMLKGACQVLEDQLTEFETIFEDKQNTIFNLQSLNRGLEEEIAELKDTLQKSSSELKEISRLRLFYESRCNKILETVKLNETRYLELKKKFIDNTTTITRLETKDDHLSKKVEQLKFEKSKLEENVLFLQENEDSAFKNVVSNQVTQLVDENLKLTTALAEAVNKAENYKNRYEALSSQHEVSDHEEVENTVQHKSTIRQQAKLIEYLQKQNQLLIKKKDKKFQIFGRRQQNDNVHPENSANETASDMLSPSFTTGHLIKEIVHVEKLEVTAETLKKKLALLMEESSSRKKQQPQSQIRKKEECILLRK